MSTTPLRLTPEQEALHQSDLELYEKVLKPMWEQGLQISVQSNGTTTVGPSVRLAEKARREQAKLQMSKADEKRARKAAKLAKLNPIKV